MHYIDWLPRAEVDSMLTKIRPKKKAKYPCIDGKGKIFANGYYMIRCGANEKESSKLSMKMIVSDVFQEFLKEKNAAWGLIREEDIWFVQIRF